MATLTMPRTDDARRPAGPVIAASILALWSAMLRRRDDGRALARAGRLGPRLLADMGLAPGTGADPWDQLPSSLLLDPFATRAGGSAGRRPPVGG